MSKTLPSSAVYTVDVPEVEKFKCNFVYNYFEPAERASGVTGASLNYVSRYTAEGGSFTQLRTRVPRFVHITWSNATLGDQGYSKNDESEKNDGTLISRNFDKIVSQDNFTTFNVDDNYVTVNFHDGGIEQKVSDVISSSFLMSNFSVPLNVDNQEVVTSLKSKNASRFLHENFYDALLNRDYVSGKQTFVREYDDLYERLRGFQFNAQFKLSSFSPLLERAISDAYSQYDIELQTLKNFVKTETSGQRPKDVFNLASYYPNIKTIDSTVSEESSAVQRKASIVGFVISKTEVLPDGELIQHKPIIIESSKKQSYVDSDVKYDSRYYYQIQSIALFTLSTKTSNNITTISKVLVSSRQITSQIVECVDNVPPPPPNDLRFAWDYDLDRLLMFWSFPVNFQQDIKKFQIFRRDNLDTSFELVKQYDFDDSTIKLSQTDIGEFPDTSVVELLTSPKCYFFDDEFTKNSKAIYSVCCIDAHGISSFYSSQFEVFFDKRTNKINVKLISGSGAPKQYPNLYVEEFNSRQSIEVMNYSKLKLYFTPSAYKLQTGKNSIQNLVMTSKQASQPKYRFHVINLESQKSDLINVTILDNDGVVT